VCRNGQSTRSENAAKLQKSSQTLGFDSYMDNIRVRTARATQEKLDVSRFKRTPLPPYSPDIAPSDFFLFGWLKTQLEQTEYNGENELYEVVNDILTGFSIKIIETVFVDWMNRLRRLIDGNGDYVS
jgi:histone-lysine N-methyltransferase SETMAR